MYLTILSRTPTKEELETVETHFTETGGDEAYATSSGR